MVILWAPDGSNASSIIIRKEIWLNIGAPEGVPKDCVQYPVFFVYNYFDPSKACAPDVGCRVNADPILDFHEASKLAKKHEAEALKSGKWVKVENIVEPTLQKPKDGVWDFRDLERLSKTQRIAFNDLFVTLSSYRVGSAISSRVVACIVERTDLAFGQRSQLFEVAKKGMEHTDGKAREEWATLVRYLSR